MIRHFSTMYLTQEGCPVGTFTFKMKPWCCEVGDNILFIDQVTCVDCLKQMQDSPFYFNAPMAQKRLQNLLMDDQLKEVLNG